MIFRTLALLSAAFLSCAGRAPVQAAAPRPNFVLMMADDHRWDAMSCEGNPIVKTPHMDRIAGEGARFRNMFVINALCAPSRATFMTGLYTHSNGVIDNKGSKIRPGVPWLPELLRSAGYEVAFCGKSHVPDNFRDRTWDYYFGYRGQGRYHNPVIAEGVGGKDVVHEGYMDDVVTSKAIEWLKGKRGKPFCLFLWFKAPHRSWDRAPRHKDLFKDVTVPKPSTFDLDAQGCPGKPAAFRDADNRIGHPNHKDVPSLDKFVKDYLATVTAVDENIGRVFKTLEGIGKLDDTVMLHTGDNGFFMGEWNRFDKRFMHEVSIRVPLIVRYPRLIKAGSRPEPMALNIDLAPTVLDFAGAPVPKEMHGRSLVPVLKGDSPGWRKDWYYEYYEFPGPHSVKKNRGVRTERYKLIHYYNDPQEYELYDLQKDPEERVNLADDPGHADLRKQLLGRIDALRRETGDNP